MNKRENKDHRPMHTEQVRGRLTPIRRDPETGLRVQNMIFIVSLYAPFDTKEDDIPNRLVGRMMVQTAGTALYLFCVGSAAYTNESRTEVDIETVGPVQYFPAVSEELPLRLTMPLPEITERTNP